MAGWSRGLPVVRRGFCDEQLHLLTSHDCLYFYKFNLYMYDLRMLIRYLVYITQVLKDTKLWLIGVYILQSLAPINPYWARVQGYGPFSLCVIHRAMLYVYNPYGRSVP
jgi:hypothetical protein